MDLETTVCRTASDFFAIWIDHNATDDKAESRSHANEPGLMNAGKQSQIQSREERESMSQETKDPWNSIVHFGSSPIPSPE